MWKLPCGQRKVVKVSKSVENTKLFTRIAPLPHFHAGWQEFQRAKCPHGFRDPIEAEKQGVEPGSDAGRGGLTRNCWKTGKPNGTLIPFEMDSRLFVWSICDISRASATCWSKSAGESREKEQDWWWPTSVWLCPVYVGWNEWTSNL